MKNIINKIRLELTNNVDENTRKSSQNFFKEKIKSYGVKIPVVHRIAKDYFKLAKFNSNSELYTFCDILWKSGYLEESFIACDWSYYIHKKYVPEDFKIFEKWVDRYVNNWASCDTLCNHTIGEFVMMYPDFLDNLKIFAESENRWMRRASAVSLIIPARRGIFLREIFEIAEILLLDKDDLVQKGYGWMLKAASEAHQKEVFDFVMERKSGMPRTALRYAIEKMPKDLKSIAMVK